MKKKLASVILGISLLCPALSHADQIFGDFKRLPDDIERGFSMGADFGGLFLTGDKRTAQNPGFALTFTTGYDFTKNISLEGIYTLGIQEAAPPPFDNVLQGGVNWFIFDLAVKGEYPIGRWAPFVEAGGGVIYTNPSFLISGENYKTDIVIGAGIEYYTFLRHYSLYFKGMYHIMSLPVDMITLSGGLKYTF
jgi:hypothetical protein